MSDIQENAVEQITAFNASEPEDVYAMLSATDEVAEEPQQPLKTEKVKAQHNVVDAKSPFKTVEVEIPEEEFSLNIPSALPAEMQEALEAAPNINILADHKGRLWVEAVKGGKDLNSHGGFFTNSLSVPESEFTNEVKKNGIHFGIDEMPARVNGKTLAGDISNFWMASHLGVGSLQMVPLFHSGFWVAVKPPSEESTIELARIIQNDKIDFGRYSYGITYSQTTSITIERLVQFALDHVLYSTVRITEKDKSSDYRDLIKMQDIQTLLWGIAAAWYPKGFNYRRPCVQDPGKCAHVSTGKLDVAKLLWVNRAKLTDREYGYLSYRKSASITLDNVAEYQKQLAVTLGRDITICEGTNQELNFTLKSPTIAEYFDAGHRWIDGIVRAVETAIADTGDFDERNSIITQHGRATAMRQYSHWVEQISTGPSGGSVVISERGAIESNLAILSQQRVARKEFETKVREYMEGSTIAIVGVPSYDCPICGADQSVDKSPIDNIIPLDVPHVFFELLGGKLADISQR